MMDIVSARELANLLASTGSESLRNFASREKVSMSYSSIVACNSFFTNNFKRIPHSGELVLLDSFIGSLKSDPFNHAPICVNINEQYIADTLADAMSKYNKLYPDYQRPCSIGGLIDLAGAAVEYRKPRCFSASETKIFVEDNNTAAELKASLAGYIPEFSHDGISLARNSFVKRRQKKPRLRSKYNVVIIYSTDPTKAVDLLDFTKSSLTLKHTLASIYSKGNEILSKVIRIFPSLKISIDRVPGAQRDESVAMTSEESLFIRTTKAFFDNSVFGEYALAVFIKESKIKKLTKEAKRFGLSVCNAIKISKDPTFTISDASGEKVGLKSNVFAAVSNPLAIEVNIPSHISSENNYISKTELYTSLSEDTAVYTASLDLSRSTSIFNDTCRTVADAVIHAAYDGSNFNNGEFLLSFKLSLPFENDKDIGSSYAAILGIYRSITEMGIPLESYHISLGAALPSLSVALKAHLTGSKAFLISNVSEKDFSESVIGKDDLPNFELIKALMRGIAE